LGLPERFPYRWRWEWGCPDGDATLPLLLIPAFLGPLFLMLHTAALMQTRRLIRGRQGDGDYWAME
jgi:hypothetical protein